VTKIGAKLFILLVVSITASPHGARSESKLVFVGRGGKLEYKADANGNTIPDFSNCGYMGGGVKLPDVPVKLTLSPLAASRDDTARIQNAIDAVSTMPTDAHGIRGALLLKRGKYRIETQLRISASGVVLRGEGDGEDGTLLIAAGKKLRDLIEVRGQGLREDERSSRRITDSYVPVGAHRFTVENASGFKVGDTVIVRRNGNAAWIHFIAMDRITPRPTDPGSTKQWQPFELAFDRVITAISGNKITVDAPLVCAIETKWGGG